MVYFLLLLFEIDFLGCQVSLQVPDFFLDLLDFRQNQSLVGPNGKPI